MRRSWVNLLSLGHLTPWIMRKVPNDGIGRHPYVVMEDTTLEVWCRYGAVYYLGDVVDLD